MQIHSVGKVELPLIYPMVERLIDKALAYSSGHFSQENVQSELANGNYDLIVAIDEFGDYIGAVVAERWETRAGKKVLDILLVGGEKGSLNEWLEPMVGKLLGIARVWGCSEITASGRDGWLPYLKEIGFTKMATVYSLNL